jgi:hypothetical protein
VGHVRAVEALALLNERLGPEHLLGRTQLHRHIEDVVEWGVVEPFVVHLGHRIA